MEEVDREISEMKLSLNARARIVAESYLTAVRPFNILILLNSHVMAVQFMIFMLIAIPAWCNRGCAYRR